MYSTNLKFIVSLGFRSFLLKFQNVVSKVLGQSWPKINGSKLAINVDPLRGQHWTVIASENTKIFLRRSIFPQNRPKIRKKCDGYSGADPAL